MSNRNDHSRQWRCRLCGTKAPLQAEWCPHCGQNLALNGDILYDDELPGIPGDSGMAPPVREQPPKPPKPPKEPKPPKGKKNLLPLILGILAALLILAAVLLLRGCDSEPQPPVDTAPATTAATLPPGTTVPPTTAPVLSREDRMLMEGDKDSILCFRTGIQKNAIQTITFLNTLADAPADAWDVSYNQKGGVLAWAVPSGNLYDLYIGAEGGVVAPENCGYLFSHYGMEHDYQNLEAIHFDGNLDTSSVTDMQAMFADSGLTELDLSSFDTSSVTNMEWMFEYCKKLTKLDVSSFDTSAITNMHYMFHDCSSLKELDLSSFDMSNVQHKDDMFDGCPARVIW